MGFDGPAGAAGARWDGSERELSPRPRARAGEVRGRGVGLGRRPGAVNGCARRMLGRGSRRPTESHDQRRAPWRRRDGSLEAERARPAASASTRNIGPSFRRCERCPRPSEPCKSGPARIDHPQMGVQRITAGFTGSGRDAASVPTWSPSRLVLAHDPRQGPSSVKLVRYPKWCAWIWREWRDPTDACECMP